MRSSLVLLLLLSWHFLLASKKIRSPARQQKKRYLWTITFPEQQYILNKIAEGEQDEAAGLLDIRGFILPKYQAFRQECTLMAIRRNRILVFTKLLTQDFVLTGAVFQAAARNPIIFSILLCEKYEEARQLFFRNPSKFVDIIVWSLSQSSLTRLLIHAPLPVLEICLKHSAYRGNYSCFKLILSLIQYKDLKGLTIKLTDEIGVQQTSSALVFLLQILEALNVPASELGSDKVRRLDELFKSVHEFCITQFVSMVDSMENLRKDTDIKTFALLCALSDRNTYGFNVMEQIFKLQSCLTLLEFAYLNGNISGIFKSKRVTSSIEIHQLCNLLETSIDSGQYSLVVKAMTTLPKRYRGAFYRRNPSGSAKRKILCLILEALRLNLNSSLVIYEAFPLQFRPVMESLIDFWFTPSNDIFVKLLGHNSK